MTVRQPMQPLRLMAASNVNSANGAMQLEQQLKGLATSAIKALSQKPEDI